MEFEKYNLTITVSPVDRPELELKVALRDIKREDIMKPNYAQGGIAALVLEFEAALEDHFQTETPAG